MDYGTNTSFYDELIDFLNDGMFQIPVKSFIDENCLIFDPSIQTSTHHYTIFISYQQVVNDLLKDFCKKKHISVEDVFHGINQMNDEPDLRQVFYIEFEQIMSAMSFDNFRELMTKHNLIIQDQVLRLILASTGVIPESLLAAEILQTVETTRLLSKSGVEPSKVEIVKKSEKLEVTAISDKKMFEKQRQQLEQDMRQLALESSACEEENVKFSESKALCTKPKASAETKISSSVLHGSYSISSADSSSMSSEEAAKKWIEEAQLENTKKQPHESQIQTDQSTVDAENLKERQAFLRQQRDRLLLMRKEAREKQLGVAAVDQSQEKEIPKKAVRAGTTNVHTKDLDDGSTVLPMTTEYDKMMNQRRALAKKLKEEVIDKQ